MQLLNFEILVHFSFVFFHDHFSNFHRFSLCIPNVVISFMSDSWFVLDARYDSKKEQVLFSKKSNWPQRFICSLLGDGKDPCDSYFWILLRIHPGCIHNPIKLDFFNAVFFTFTWQTLLSSCMKNFSGVLPWVWNGVFMKKKKIIKKNLL